MLLEIIFAVVLLVAFIAEVVLTETEHFGWATALLLVCGAACYYFNVYGAALWVKAHVAQTLAFAGIYIVAGVAWSFMKWFSYLISYRDKWREAKEEDAKNMPHWIEDAKNEPHWINGGVAGGDRSPPDSQEAWESYVTSRRGYRLKAFSFSKPQASDNKAKITAWMAFWPFSFLGTFINDPIRRLFNFLFSSFKKLYQQMSDHLFKDLEPKEEK